MRIVIKKYADGGESIVETTDGGETVIQQLGGTREVGKRIAVYLEASADNNDKGLDRLLEALSWLREEVERRKESFAAKNEKNKARRGHKTPSH